MAIKSPLPCGGGLGVGRQIIIASGFVKKTAWQSKKIQLLLEFLCEFKDYFLKKALKFRQKCHYERSAVARARQSKEKIHKI